LRVIKQVPERGGDGAPFANLPPPASEAKPPRVPLATRAAWNGRLLTSGPAKDGYGGRERPLAASVARGDGRAASDEGMPANIEKMRRVADLHRSP
jgi:hypothetical protein